MSTVAFDIRKFKSKQAVEAEELIITTAQASPDTRLHVPQPRAVERFLQNSFHCVCVCVRVL